jgi:hypothetical protein
MPISDLAEKPGGARNVVSWDVRIERDYRPVYLLSNKRAGYESGTAQNVVVQIGVQFDDDESAQEFEAKVRAMLPEVVR